MLGHAIPGGGPRGAGAAGKRISIRRSCDLMLDWAGIMQKLVPSAERIEFTNSGTEAIMLGVRLARAYTGGGTIRFQFHFAGAYDAVTWATRNLSRFPFRGGEFLPFGGGRHNRSSDEQEAVLEEALRNRDVAAVMVEAAGASSGVVEISLPFIKPCGI